MFRHGQWVLFRHSQDLPGVHLAANGCYVGIFHKGGKDATGEVSPPAIFPVGADGHNVGAFVGGSPITLRFGVGEVIDPVPCTTVAYLPEPRRAHLPADYQLLP